MKLKSTPYLYQMAVSHLPAALLMCGALAHPAQSLADCARDAMLVFDGSASMQEIGFDIQEATRIVDARSAIRQAMPRIAPYRRVGLLIYGPGPKDACSNIDLRFGPVDQAAEPIIDEIERLNPSGMTPLAASVHAAAQTLDYERRPGIVVLVTDGNETCGGRPCALADALARTGRDLTVHVIGFKVVVDFFGWDNPEQSAFADGDTVAKCLADRTGGMFVSTQTVEELTDALQETLGCPLIGQIGPERLSAKMRLSPT